MRWSTGIAALAPEAQRAWVENHVDDLHAELALKYEQISGLEGQLRDARLNERARVLRALERVLMVKTDPKYIDVIFEDVMDELAKEEEGRRT